MTPLLLALLGMVGMAGMVGAEPTVRFTTTLPDAEFRIEAVHEPRGDVRVTDRRGRILLRIAPDGTWTCRYPPRECLDKVSKVLTYSFNPPKHWGRSYAAHD